MAVRLSLVCLLSFVVACSSQLILPHLSDRLHWYTDYKKKITPRSDEFLAAPSNLTMAEVHINMLSPEAAQQATAVDQLPLHPLTGPKSYSGFVTVNQESGAAMWFWFFEALNSTKPVGETPLILWLQGGPGCSSQLGNLNEFGPYQVEDDMQLHPREHTWNQKYHLLFVDNPLGAGFSFAGREEDYSHNQAEMADNLYSALTVFFSKYPAYADSPLYVFGESFGGHWVPTIAHRILKNNHAADVTKPLNLRGIGIGNGWTDPQMQLTQNHAFAYNTALIDKRQRMQIERLEEQGIELIYRHKYTDALFVFDEIMSNITSWAGGCNIYDIRDYNHDHKAVDYHKWLELPSTKVQLHVGEHTWSACSGPAYQALQDNFMVTVKFNFPIILKEIPVLLYNGQMDLIVNTPSAEAWIDTIPWPGQKQFQSAARHVWKVDGKTVGMIRGYERLTFAVVLAAGHMAPSNQIRATQDMVERFIEGKSWTDGQEDE